MISLKVGSISFAGDFENDMVREIGEFLNGFNAKFPNKNSDDMIKSFYSYVHRMITPSKREIVMSNEMVTNNTIKNYSHLDFEKFKEDSEEGLDINCFLSKSVMRLDYNDVLFNDWKIHHFHLGSGKDKTGFVTRTGPVLMAICDEDKIYCIGIYEHGQWSETSLITIAIENWPFLFEKYLLKGILSCESTFFNTNNVEKMREAGGQMLIELNGNFYAPPGGGYATSGLSINVRMRSDRLFMVLRDMEKRVEKAIQEKIEVIEQIFTENPLINIVLRDCINIALNLNLILGYSIEANVDEGFLYITAGSKSP
jgi:hypothetical protein